MAIQTPQFQPATRPVTTAAAPGREFAAPAPVMAPAPAQPIIAQGSMPTPPKAYDDSFIRSLQAFGASIGHLGNALQDERVRATDAATATATSDMASMDITEATTYAERVKLEGKNRAVIDGTMRAFGTILSTKLQAEVAGMPPDRAAALIRERTSEYRERFKNEAFDKAYGPQAAQLVSHLQGLAAKEENEQLRGQLKAALIAEVVTHRGEFAHMDEEQQTKIVHSYLDEVIEKSIKDGTLGKHEADEFYWKLAEVAVSKGDEVLTKAIMNKQRGDQPSFASYHQDAPVFIAKAKARAQELNEDQTRQDTVRYDLAADKGTFATLPDFKGMSNEQIIDVLGERGFSTPQITSWLKSSEDTNTLYLRDKHGDHWQATQTAISKGDLANAPSVNSELDLLLRGGVAGVLQAREQARNNLAQRWREEKDAILASKVDTARTHAAQNLASGPAADFVAATDTAIVIDGKSFPLKADDLRLTAMSEKFKQIDRDTQDPSVATSLKMTALIERNFLPDEMKQTLKAGAVSSSFRGVVAKTPEERAVAYSVQKRGLDLYRALVSRGGLPVVSTAINDEQAMVYDAIEILSTSKYGGDDYLAMQDLTLAANTPPDIVTSEINRLNLGDRLDKLDSQLIKELGGDTVRFDTSQLKHKAQKSAAVLVRMGVNADVAYDVASQYLSRAYTSYEGLVVPKTGDQTYAEVQKFFMEKMKETDPYAVEAMGNVALVPLISSDSFGRSGLHALRSTDNGTPVEAVKNVTFKLRDGTTFDVNPRGVDIADVKRIREAMRFEMESGAIAARGNSTKIDYYDQKNKPPANALFSEGASIYTKALAEGKTTDKAKNEAVSFVLGNIRNGVNHKLLTEVRASLDYAIKHHPQQ